MIWDHENEGERIQRLREEKDMTEDQLADLSGLSPETICRIETAGHSILDDYYRAKLAAALQVPVDYLQNGDSHSERQTSASIDRMLERGECTRVEAEEIKEMAKVELRSSSNLRIPLRDSQIKMLLEIRRSLKGN